MPFYTKNIVKMIKIALDSGCLNAKKANPILNELEKLDENGNISLVTSTVLEKEQNSSNKNDFWRNKYLKIIEQRKKVFEVARYGVSSFGEAIYADQDKRLALAKLFPDPNDYYDLWLLQTALQNYCDYFLTQNTKDFFNKNKKAKIEKLGIKIRLPEKKFLEELFQLLDNSK